MAQKFFESVLASRKIISSGRGYKINGLSPIKPAQDIADFQYPPESSFYQKGFKKD